MSNKTIQLLRSSTIYTSLDSAKTALNSKLTGLQPGEPAIAYYKEDGVTRAILGIGGTAATLFINDIEVGALIAAAKSELIDGATSNADTLKKLEDKINALDLSSVGGTGKVITTISQTDGKVSATAIDLKATNVAYDNTSDTQISSATTVSAAIKELDSAIKKSNEAQKSYKIVSAATTDTNVKEAYKIQVSNNGSEYADVEGSQVIKIYKDSSLMELHVVKEDANGTYTVDGKKYSVDSSGQILLYVYVDTTGTKKYAVVNLAHFLMENEFNNGLKVTNGVVGVLLDSGNESFLTVSDNGIKLSGVQTAIDTAKQAAIDTVVGKSGDATTANTVYGAKAYADNAVSTAVESLDSDVTSTGGARVTVKVSELNGKITGVTVTENDIAKASTLTTETNRAKSAEDTIEASVGLSAAGAHNATTGNYTSGATTIVGEISALDTQVKKNADAIATLDANAIDVVSGNGITVTEGGTNNTVHTVAVKIKDNDPILEVTSSGVAVKTEALWDCGEWS